VSTAPLAAPFRGERYASLGDPSARIAPPYDVLTPQARARLAAEDPHNIVHLMLPEAPPGEDRYARAAALLAEWRQAGVLARDTTAAVYVLAQEFALPSGERRSRIGMFAAVAAEPYETGRVRPHERTHAGPKADRLALLRATATNLESIFLVAPDRDRRLETAVSGVAKRTPDVRAEQDGVRMRLWVVTGEAARDLALSVSAGPLYIADGHHRYETAVAYAAGRPGADRVLAFIVSASDPGLAILATHRIIARGAQEVAPLLATWRAWFDVGRVAPCADRMERLRALGRDGTACLVALPDGGDLSLALKANAPLDRVAGLGRTPAVRALDVARVEALVVRALAGESGMSTLTYTPDPYAVFDAVRHGGAAAAVLLNPPTVEQVFAVADAQDVMPPKSTYFVPKVPSGLVLLPLA